jgi:RNA recognition motif-containing protein
MIMEVTKRLFVGNLPDGVTENEIRPLFNKFGRIDTLEIKTKKGVDGDVVSTFAFVDFSTSDAKLSKCKSLMIHIRQFKYNFNFVTAGLEKLNGSQVKNSQIRVQVAKENFLARLQSERTASKIDPKSDKRVSREPAPPVQDYNPMAMFKSRKVTNVENEVTPKSKSKKFTEEEIIVEDNNTGGKGNALSMLESFSGMWKDLDTAPVAVEREARRTIKTDENKKSKATAEVVVEETVAKVKSVKKVVEDPKKKELDNQKRIQSLQQRNEALKAQQNLIKSALSQTDSQKNRKIVFNLDDEEEESVPSKPVAKEQPTKKKGKEKKSNMKLFDDEEEEEADPEADSEQFRVKPHLEGKSGKEVTEIILTFDILGGKF